MKIKPSLLVSQAGKYLMVFILLAFLCNIRGHSANSQKNKQSQKVFNVMDYGAVGDGKTPDSNSIQKAIDAASQSGDGAQVLIPGGHRYLVGTVQLKSNIDFHLEKGAELFVSTNPSDYIQEAVIIANNVQNLKISGTGNINGRDLEFMSHYSKETEIWIPKDWRPKIFIITKCTGLEIRDITFGNAPNWGLHMLGCENVLIENITIKNNLEVPNCDGIDPDHCRNVIIRNCHIVCGDDGVVVKATRQTENYGASSNILVQDCVIETQDSGLKIGTETTQDIHNIVFERCKIITSNRGICIQLRDEGNVYDITFKDIEFVARFFSDPWWGRGEGISFTAIPRTSETKLGSIHHVKVMNVTGTMENCARIYGTKESRIQDINFENVSLTLNRTTSYKGGLVDNRPTKVYPEIEQQNTPGINIRFADKVMLNKCSVSWGTNRPGYYTHAVEATDVTDIKVVEFKGESAFPKLYKAISIE